MSKVSLKNKLLEAVGDIDIGEIGTAAMVDILVGRIKTLEARVSELNAENTHERLRLHSEYEALREERKRLLSDPLYGMHGAYAWEDLGGDEIVLTVGGGVIRDMVVRRNNIDHLLQQISAKHMGAS